MEVITEAIMEVITEAIMEVITDIPAAISDSTSGPRYSGGGRRTIGITRRIMTILGGQ